VDPNKSPAIATEEGSFQRSPDGHFLNSFSASCGRLSVRQTNSSSGVARGIKRDYFNLQVAVMTLASITRAVVAHGSFTRAITR
jgi:hypothetical protein